jgi:hypothetical protein
MIQEYLSSLGLSQTVKLLQTEWGADSKRPEHIAHAEGTTHLQTIYRKQEATMKSEVPSQTNNSANTLKEVEQKQYELNATFKSTEMGEKHPKLGLSTTVPASVEKKSIIDASEQNNELKLNQINESNHLKQLDVAQQPRIRANIPPTVDLTEAPLIAIEKEKPKEKTRKDTPIVTSFKDADLLSGTKVNTLGTNEEEPPEPIQAMKKAESRSANSSAARARTGSQAIEMMDDSDEDESDSVSEAESCSTNDKDITDEDYRIMNYFEKVGEAVTESHAAHLQLPNLSNIGSDGATEVLNAPIPTDEDSLSLAISNNTNDQEVRNDEMKVLSHYEKLE